MALQRHPEVDRRYNRRKRSGEEHVFAPSAASPNTWKKTNRTGFRHGTSRLWAMRFEFWPRAVLPRASPPRSRERHLFCFRSSRCIHSGGCSGPPERPWGAPGPKPRSLLCSARPSSEKRLQDIICMLYSSPNDLNWFDIKWTRTHCCHYYCIVIIY